MLNNPTPFPLVGSYALYETACETHLVRIQHRDMSGREGAALISFPGSFAASGSKTVPLADLIDGTPLTLDERAEMQATLRAMGAAAIHNSRAARAKRYLALRERDIRSETMQRLMERAGLRSTFQLLREREAA